MHFDQDNSTALPEKKIPARLKPLKYQEYRTRGFTEKKMKNPIEVMMDNQSTTVGCSER